MLKVGFVCESACFSQVAKALGKFFAGSLMVCYAAGLESEEMIQDATARFMHDLYHIQMVEEDLSLQSLPEFDLVVVLGPAIALEGTKFVSLEEWEFDTKVPEDKLIEAIRSIERKVLQLAERIEAGELNEAI